jgi:hypothetical protein
VAAMALERGGAADLVMLFPFWFVVRSFSSILSSARCGVHISALSDTYEAKVSSR